MEANIQKVYEREREKRLTENSQGAQQYLDLASTMAMLDPSADNPWVENGKSIERVVPNEGHIKYLVVGAGFSGILVAARLLHQGIKLSDILIVDSAGGFGGTWYWNRFPGLMCDIESYIYLPLLEETGYMPSRKYASGEEIRKYSQRLADHFKLSARAMFQTMVKTLTWNDSQNSWTCGLLERPKGLPEAKSSIVADFVILATGLFPGPKIPDIPGVKDFKGSYFHTNRWDYNITGGSPDEPVLHKLKNQRVGFVGTGATGVQVVPAVAKYAGDLYVFQRTASAVDVRGQGDTDVKEWEQKIANKPGWWIERNENFHAFSQGQDPPPAENLVNDAFACMKAYGPVFGSPNTVTQENLQEWIDKMYALDNPRAEEIRKRAKDVVKDDDTGRKLQAWYPGWCKRPCFHDDYLAAFNRPNVHLVDFEDGKGITAVTEHGIVAGGQEHVVDIIIWGTGYTSALEGSLAGRAGIEVTGKNGVSMEQRAAEASLNTLHGCIAVDFPNLLYEGLSQCGTGPNQTHRMDIIAQHIAYILTEAGKRAGDKRPIIEVSTDAAEAWAQQVASTALTGAPMLGCTPSYFNSEGDLNKLPDEVKTKLARMGVWGRGINDFAKVCADWRAEGSMQGIEVAAV